MRMQAVSVAARKTLPAIILFSLLAATGAAQAQRQERQGKQVVEAVCGGCHLSGKEGAPRIGDAVAWAPRAEQGLASLSRHAIEGIRKMPAHGGSAGVSDIEIERAIVYMINQSGGKWIEPIGGATPAVVSTSERIVDGQCARCHQTGKQGAPKIGDRTAWTARLSKGLDKLVASAVHGHGPMPARGGLPDLSGEEIRGAILYMFNYGLPPVPPAPPVAAADPHHRQLAGMDIYFGMIRADAMRATQADAQGPGGAKLSIPSGAGYYHLTLALADTRSQVPVTDAQVTMKVSDGMTSQTKTLSLVAANNAVSYGNFFKFSSGTAYNITTEIKRPGVPAPVTATFEYRAP